MEYFKSAKKLASFYIDMFGNELGKRTEKEQVIALLNKNLIDCRIDQLLDEVIKAKVY